MFILAGPQFQDVREVLLLIKIKKVMALLKKGNTRLILRKLNILIGGIPNKKQGGGEYYLRLLHGEMFVFL
jgi:hypothetical protein